MSAIEKWIKCWEKTDNGECHTIDKPYLETIKARRRNKSIAAESLVKSSRNGLFHFKLGSMPYVGNLKKATIFLLMRNPGVSCHDYEDIANCQAKNLFDQNKRQELDYCFAFREEGPRGWAPYYLDKFFGGFIREYPEKERACIQEKLAKKVAILELVPYFAQNWSLIDRYQMAGSLPTSQLALDAAKEIARDENNLIITRWQNGATLWKLNPNRVCTSKARSGLSRCAKKAIKAKLDKADCD